MEDRRRSYFLDRARTSKKMADQARNPEIKAIHMDFYARYLRRADEEVYGHIEITVPREA